ncbi:MAG: VOC family protein [Clostridia bacterium]|nr:VOC family protein [Clostridia bacterium]
MITGIHHIAIKAQGVDEFNKVLYFYGELLGLTEVRRWGSEESPIVMLDTGAGLLEIFADAAEKPTVGAVHHIAFATDDVDGHIEKVRNAGFEIIMEPKDIVIGSEPPYPARIAFCRGVLGEEVEFFAEK